MAVVIPSSLSDHPSLVGIVRFPSCTITEEQVPIPIIIKNSNGDYMGLTQIVDMAAKINGATKTSGAYFIPKSKVTDFYPYTFYVLADGESEPLIMHPQYMETNQTFKGEFALSNQPVERYYAPGYKGDLHGIVYNITNLNQMMLPTATNEGINYMNANANTMMVARQGQVTSNVLNGISAIGSAFATGGMSLIGGGVSSVVSGIQSIKETDARNKDIALTPSTISSYGTPSTRKAFGTDCVKLYRYSVKENVKAKINSYCERYGNKYNNYATIDLKNYKGYVKMISPDIDSKIDNQYIQKLISILERGVYIE